MFTVHFIGTVDIKHTTMYAAKAGNVTLRCSREPNAIANTLRWRRLDGSPIVTCSGKLHGNDKHYIITTLNNTFLSLVITNVTKKDSGTYACDWQTHLGFKQ